MHIRFLKNIEKEFRKYIPKRIKGLKNIRTHFMHKNGIEIGGPTGNFEKKGFLPLYRVLGNLDNVNFSSNTVWEGSLSEGLLFKFDKKIGYQYIREASDLYGISNNKYDFLLSSHNMEHLANPLKTIQEWKRVVKPNGSFLFILPNKEGTFDYKRPVTTIEHLIDDLKKNTPESDETHFEEVLSLHDLSKDPGGLESKEFKERTYKNLDNRCLHHHVFDLELLGQIAEYSSIEIILLAKFSKMHLVLLGKNIK